MDQWFIVMQLSCSPLFDVLVTMCCKLINTITCFFRFFFQDMADYQVVCSQRARSQPLDSEVKCPSDRECMQVQPQITEMLTDELSHAEQDHPRSDNHSVPTDELLDAELPEFSQYCDAVSPENWNQDFCIDINEVVSKQQSSHAPFGYPPCLQQIVQSAISVLDFSAAEDCVLQNSISGENASVDRGHVTGGACYNGNSGIKVLKGNCTERNEKQAQLANGNYYLHIFSSFREFLFFLYQH